MKNAKRKKRIFLSETQITNGKSEEAHNPRQWRRYLIAAGIAILVSFMLYGNILQGGFVYDDALFSTRQDIRKAGSLLHVWSQPYYPRDEKMGGGFYRPLWVASLATNFILFGGGTFSFHLVNTLLYAAILILLYAVSRRLFGGELLPAFISLFFAFLPIHTEAVANIKSRDELLSALFVLGSWYVFLRAFGIDEKRSLLKGWLSGALFFLSLLSKENGVFIPVLFFVVWYMDRRPSFVKQAAASFPFIAAYTVYFFLRLRVLGPYSFFEYQTYYVLNPLTGVTTPARIFTAFELLYLYVAKTLFPYHLSASYEHAVLPIVSQPFASWMSLAGIVVGSLIVTAIALRTPRAVKLGAFFFAVAYVTVSKFLFAKGALFGERMIFLPSVGLSMAAGWFFDWLTHRRRVVGILSFGICLSVYAAIAIPRNLIWREEVKFFEQMVKDAPASAHARSSLAIHYFNTGRLRESLIQAQKAYEIYPKHPPTLNVLGKLAYIQKDYLRTALLMRQALESEPESANHRNFLALALVKLGKYDESVEVVKAQYATHPESSNWRFIIAVNLYKTGKVEEALSEKYSWADTLNRSQREQILRDF